MLDSHRNLLEPRPSDRLRIGDCVLDIPLREITRGDGGEPTRITLKAEGVLLVLVANAGKVVSREALMEWVWPDTMPTDDVITQAVTQLRKALGNGQAYIETIAKQGYRLLAPVEWIVDDAPATIPVAMDTAAADATHAGDDRPAAHAAVERAPAASANAHRGRRTAWALAAGVAVAALATLAFWRDGGRKTPAPATSAPVTAPMAGRVPYRRVTAFPGAEIAPSFSPDGTLLAYSQANGEEEGAGLRLQAPTAATARVLTPNTRGQGDLYPAWSPDGSTIAFVRQRSDGCSVMLVAAAGGEPRRLGDCLGDRPHMLAWYPDGRRLIGAASPMAFSPKRRIGAIHNMRVEDGNWVPMRYARAESDVDIHPMVSPDGRWIVFQRNVSLGDLWRMPVGGGEPERLTDLRTNLFGFDWMRDEGAIVLSHYSGAAPRLSRLDLASGRLTDYPGEGDMFTFPTVAPTSGDIAFVIDESRSVIRRLDADGDRETGGAEAGVAVFETTASNMMPGVAPDGRQLAFISDRTGRTVMWWVDQQAPETLRPIDGFQPVPRFPPRWNPGSTRFLMVGAGDGQGEQARGVFEVDPRSGEARQLPLPVAQPTHAEYHADPEKLLVVAESEQGRLGLALYDRSRTPWRELGRIEDVALALMDRARDRVVFARLATGEIWQADADLRNPRRLDTVAQPWRLRTMAVSDDGVWVLDVGEGCDWWWRPVGAADGEARRGRCLRARAMQEPEGLSRAPGRDELFVSVAEDMGSDIGLLPSSAFGDDRRVAASR